MSTLPMTQCVGINVAVPIIHLEIVGEHIMAGIPGGAFVMGSSADHDTQPHWEEVSSFMMGRTAVTEGQYRSVLDRPGEERSPIAHAASNLIWNDAQEYVHTHGEGLRLPKDAEWEYAARGPAVSMREEMDRKGVRPRDFARFAAGRFENFVLGVGSEILLDPSAKPFRSMLESRDPFWGWRVHPTPSGALTHEEAWYAVMGSATDADWGPAGPYGVQGMPAGVWEWVEDRYTRFDSPDPKSFNNSRVVRGAAYICNMPKDFLAAHRGYDDPNLRRNFQGFRVARSGISPK